MKIAVLLTTGLPWTAAFPWAMEASMDMRAAEIKRQAGAYSRPPQFTTRRLNTGELAGPHIPFDAAAQFVNVGPGSGRKYG